MDGIEVSVLVLVQMELERALVDGEHDAEMVQLEREKELLNQLNEQLVDMEKKSLVDKSQVCKSESLSLRWSQIGIAPLPGTLHFMNPDALKPP